MHQLFSNNATGLLAIDALAAASTVQVVPGAGALFPAPTGGQFFTATLENTSGVIEVVLCTDVTGDVLTVTRAQENTTAVDFLAGVSRIECRPTAGVMASLLQAGEAIFTADADLGGNSLIGGEVLAVPLRGAPGDTSNEIVVPANGDRPTVGGIDILIATDALLPQFIIGMWSGLLVDIPAGWALCDGGFGTPDLSGRFIVSFADGDPLYGTVGNTGGDSTTTGLAGGHNHTGAVQPTLLDATDIPTLSLSTQLSTSTSNSDNHTNTNAASAGTNSGAPFSTPVSYINNSPTLHAHAITAEADHAHTYTPAYYVLAFIMRL